MWIQGTTEQNKQRLAGREQIAEESVAQESIFVKQTTLQPQKSRIRHAGNAHR
jgi:hypothetical protein